MKKIFILLIGLTIAGLANADEDAVLKFRNFTPQQIQALPDKVRRSEVPMMYLLASKEALASNALLVFKIQLNSLMYPAAGDYSAAVRAFQADLGDREDGILTVHQIDQLHYRSKLQKLSRISFPTEFKSWIAIDRASIQGTSTTLFESTAWPANYLTIECFKRRKQCEVNEIVLDMPKKDLGGPSYSLILNNSQYYDITRWTGDVIDAEGTSKPNSCRTTSLNFNFKTKELFFVTKNAGGNCDFLGKPIFKLEKPRIAQIVDGEKIVNAEFAKIDEAAYKSLASDFRKKVDAFQAQPNKD